MHQNKQLNTIFKKEIVVQVRWFSYHVLLQLNFCFCMEMKFTPDPLFSLSLGFQAKRENLFRILDITEAFAITWTTISFQYYETIYFLSIREKKVSLCQLK